ncbi:MAG: DUF2249 domain-containing protein [Halopenitus sp.]
MSTSDDTTETTENRLDVRDVEGPPFTVIDDALDDLPNGGSLTLINSFEPEPLYEVLEARGFSYRSEQVAPDEWHVHIEDES